MSKTSNYILILMLVISGLGIAMIGYWNLYPYDIMEIDNAQNIKTDKEVYQAGDRITYFGTYCKKKDITGIVYRSITDGIRISYEPFISNVPVGCRKITKMDLIIPEFIDAGIYHIDNVIEYHPNPIRTIYVRYRTRDFEVIK